MTGETNAEMDVDKGGGRTHRVPVNYPANSMKSKQATAEEREPATPIVTGKVIQRKRSFFARTAGLVFEGVGDSIFENVVVDVLVPALKNTLTDMVTQSVERVLYGEVRSRSAGTGRTNYTTYTSPGYKKQQEAARSMSRTQRSSFDFGDLILPSRAEAEDVIEALRDLISQYEMATVNDLYERVGITASFTDEKWGWTDLRSASVRLVNGGYLLILPRPVALTP